MGFAKKVILIVCWAAFVGTGTVQAAKSVFIISQHGVPSQAQAYAIEADQVTYQAQVDVDTYNPGNGAVGNAVWSDKRLMFVTYEQSPMIVWASTKSLEKVGEFDTGITYPYLSGIAIDHENERIYVVKRGEPYMYRYSFSQGGNTLLLEGQHYLQVQGGSLTAWGIALDETNDLLYISTGTNRVHAYNTGDWTHSHYIDITVNGTARSAVGIAVDEVHGYLYTGDWDSHNYLVRTATSPPYASIEVEIMKPGSPSENVIGVDVDDDTGLVYCTTYHHDFRVYDSALLLKDTEENDDISGPGGVAVPRGDVWYKPDWFVLSKADNIVDCASPPDQFTYTISYNANGYADTSVVIVDYLPLQVDYLSCTGGGSYDLGTHTVTWTLGDISGSASGTLEISVQVNDFARPGTTITNAVEMEGDTYYSKRTEDTEICCWYPGDIIYVDEDATGYNNGTSWDDAYTELRDALAHVELCPGAVTAIWVAAGTYKPTESPADTTATFELIDGIDMYGHFEGIGRYETSIEDRVFDNPANESRLEGQIGTSPSEAVQYVVTAGSITDLVFDGFTVRGAYSGEGILSGAGILINDCPNADLRIVRCKVQANNKYGIDSTAAEDSASHFELEDCEIAGNSMYGLKCYRSWPLIVATEFDGENLTQSAIHAEYSAVDIFDSEVKNHTATGIYPSHSDLVAEGCLIEDNGASGVECSNCWAAVTSCVIQNNDGAGIGSLNFSDIEVTHCKIFSNGYDGIFVQDGLDTTITNNWIYGNLGVGAYTCGGIYVKAAIDQAHIRNNTICSNNTYGIYFESGTEPEIVNCIVYDNTTQIGTAGGPLGNVTYSCIEGGYAGTGNISGDPVFLGAPAGDYHLKKESPCVDAGKANSTEDGELDIDGNPRLMDSFVDMGADEDYPHCDPQYDDWVSMERPNCWMTPYQCDGDADCKTSGFPFNYRVFSGDLALLIDNWQKKAGDPTLDPCADMDHKDSGFPFNYRVFAGDLAILIDNWQKKDEDILGNCVERGCQQRSQSTDGTALSAAEAMDWLARLWLDPDVRDRLDKDDWRKLYESLKAL